MNNEEENILYFFNRWHEGDQEALNELIKQLLPWLQKHVHKSLDPILRKWGKTEDYVQEVLYKFLKTGPPFTISNIEHFRNLLLRILKNTYWDKYDWIMAKRRNLLREHPLPPDTILEIDPAFRSKKTPSNSTTRHEYWAWINFAMPLLSQDKQEIIYLRFDGLKFKEIGVKLGISPDSARKRFERAFSELIDIIWKLRRGKLPENSNGES